MPTNGDCTDLPTGVGLDGSVTNVSGNTRYVFPTSCPDARPGDIVATTPAQHGTHSVRTYGTGLVLNPITLTCVRAVASAERDVRFSACRTGHPGDPVIYREPCGKVEGLGRP